MDNLTHRAKITVAMRAVAGVWFALTGFALGLISFLLTSRTLYPIKSFEFVMSAIVPATIFGFFGSIAGARILLASAGPGALVAALHGTGVVALSFALYVVGLAVNATLTGNKPDLGGLIFSFFYIMALWGSLRLVPTLLIGAFSGWLLYRLERWWST